jgi:hypothetical protein
MHSRHQQIISIGNRLQNGLNHSPPSGMTIYFPDFSLARMMSCCNFTTCKCVARLFVPVCLILLCNVPNFRLSSSIQDLGLLCSGSRFRFIRATPGEMGTICCFFAEICNLIWVARLGMPCATPIVELYNTGRSGTALRQFCGIPDWTAAELSPLSACILSYARKANANERGMLETRAVLHFLVEHLSAAKPLLWRYLEATVPHGLERRTATFAAFHRMRSLPGGSARLQAALEAQHLAHAR